MKDIIFNKMKTNFIFKIFASILVLLTLLYSFTYFNISFHSDAAAVNLLAREQMRTGQFFPETWCTSTNIFLLEYNLIMIPLSFFIDDQLFLRNLAVGIVIVLFVLLFRHYSKSILKSDFYLIGICLIFSCTSPNVIAYAFTEAAYLIGLVLIFGVIFSFSKSVSDELRIIDKKYFALLLLMVFYCGLQGSLGLAYYLLPLLGSICMYFIIKHFKSTYIELRKDLFSGSLLLGMILLFIVGGLLGRSALGEYINFTSPTVTVEYPDYSNLIPSFFQFVLSAIGYKAQVTIFSINGLMNVVILFAFLAVVVCYILLFFKYKEQSFPMKIFMLYSLVLIGIHVYFDFTIYCTNTGHERYFFRPLIMLWIVSSYYIYHYIYLQGVVSKVLVICAVMIFSFPCALLNIEKIPTYPEEHKKQTALVDFLAEQGLKHGYATFWNAGKYTVLSDFDVEIAGVHLTNPISPMYWLSSEMSYDPELYEGESFLLLTKSEDEEMRGTLALERLGKPTEVLTKESYVIYVYPYNISENEFKGERMHKWEMIRNMAISNPEMKINNYLLSLSEGEVIYGPYLSLEPGSYQVDLQFQTIDAVSIRITSDAGNNLIIEDTIQEQNFSICFETAEQLENFEVVLTTNTTAMLESIKITETD